MPRKKKTRRRATAKKAGRPSRLASASLADLRAELERRQSALQARRDELVAELEEIDREMGSVGTPVRRGPGRPPKSATATGRRPGRPAGKRGPGRPSKKVGRPRGRRAGGGASLVESLHKVLQGRTMSVTEVTDAVQKAGYKTSSANFRTIVNQALTANPNKFRKVARGQYTSK